jgi:hypothetical protein
MRVRILSSLLQGVDRLTKAICAVPLLERRDDIGPSDDLGLVTARHGFPHQLKSDCAAGAHRIDMRLYSVFQIGDIRPGNLRIAHVPRALSEEELSLGEVLILEFPDELQGRSVV